MNIELTLENYRCFPDPHPAHFEISPGFTSFLGPNNSGKSSLLRFFFEFRSLFQNVLNPNYLVALLQGDFQNLALNEVPDRDEVFSRDNDLAIRLSVKLNGIERASSHGVYINEFVFIIDRDLQVSLRSLVNGQELTPARQINYDRGRGSVPDVGKADWTLVLHAITVLATAKYVGPFRNALNVTQSRNYYDIAVGTAVVLAWRTLKTGPTARNRQRAIQLEGSIASIFGFRSFSLDASEDATSFVAVVNERSFRLQDLGAGLAQFILVFLAAATSEGALLLIDEPESNLHPSLQLSFLTSLASYFSYGVLFATHNIGLARASSSRIYSFRLIDEGASSVRPFDATARLPELLGEMSFGAYQDLGQNRVLLVEGPTEVTAVSELLRKLGKDHEVVLIPLSGDSLINARTGRQLAEVKRLSSTVGALIDSERKSEASPLDAQRRKFAENCVRLGIDCHVLERRAFENYLPERAIQAAKSGSYQALGPYDSLKDTKVGWGKDENWRICQRMTWEEFEQTGDLFSFLKRFSE